MRRVGERGPLGVDALEPDGPLRALAELFSLSRIDLDLVILALAPEVNAGYGRVFAYLQNDIGRTRPNASLAMDVLADSWEQRLAVRARIGLCRSGSKGSSRSRWPATGIALVVE